MCNSFNLLLALRMYVSIQCDVINMELLLQKIQPTVNNVFSIHCAILYFP